MSEDRMDDQMIEIGDPTEEPTSAEFAHTVVIQYHERGGVPWMLIPPLLVASAVGAIALYHKLAPRPAPLAPPALVRTAEAPAPPPLEPTLPATTTTAPAATEPAPVPEARAVEAPAPVEPSIAPVEPVNEPAKAAESVPSPRVEGLGFDPKALEAERRADAPADPALAAVARDLANDDRDLPREVDPDLLPPDPRLARARQQQRRVDALRKVDEERARFHAELKEVCRQFREQSGPEILELRKNYTTKLEPSAEKKAAQLLGKHGKFVGADRRTRIELLRSLGYPEPVILGDLFENYGEPMIGERGGPRSQGEALYLAALFLLRNPPTSDANPSRTVSEIGGGSAPRNSPFTSVLGNGAGPAR